MEDIKSFALIHSSLLLLIFCFVLNIVMVIIAKLNLNINITIILISCVSLPATLYAIIVNIKMGVHKNYDPDYKYKICAHTLVFILMFFVVCLVYIVFFIKSLNINIDNSFFKYDPDTIFIIILSLFILILNACAIRIYVLDTLQNNEHIFRPTNTINDPINFADASHG